MYIQELSSLELIEINGGRSLAEKFSAFLGYVIGTHNASSMYHASTAPWAVMNVK